MCSKSRSAMLKQHFSDYLVQYKDDLCHSKIKEDKSLAASFVYFKWDYAEKLLDLYLVNCKERQCLSFL